MADLTITAASVAKSGTNTTETGVAGATITAGQAVYLDSTTNTYKLTDCNLAGAKDFRGIALDGASSGQPLTVLTGGDITIGATMTAGLAYYASATAGGICPYADLVSTDAVIFIGHSHSTTVLHVAKDVTGVTL
jgi:hypothetical protein